MNASRTWLLLRVKRAAGWQDRRCHQRNDEADAEILDTISDMPSYGYRRVWGILCKQHRTEGLPQVTANQI